MKPWLKKLDELKQEAEAKKTRITAEGFRDKVRLGKAFRDEIKAGLPYAAAVWNAVEKTGVRVGTVDINLRGWHLALSLYENEEQGWVWYLSASPLATLGSGSGKVEELAEMVRHLGADYGAPTQRPTDFGGVATHWQWKYEAPQEPQAKEG